LSDIPCPHCGVPNPAGSAFCESCGKALPVASAGPTVAGTTATTTAGRRFVGDGLKKSMNKAFVALLVVAILQTIFGPVVLMAQKSKMERENPGETIVIEPWAYAVIFGIAGLFWVLTFWARRSPLPAAITGLVAFITLHLIEAAADPASLARGFIMKIFVIAMLVSAIRAGIEYRKLQAAAVEA
jgi:hypothetical protein